MVFTTGFIIKRIKKEFKKKSECKLRKIGERLGNLIEKKVIIFIDQAGKSFKYAGILKEITNEFYIIIDEKLGKIHLKRNKIITITEAKND